MRAENVAKLPPEAFARGIKKLHERYRSQNVIILGFDTEYDAETQEIISYQLSDGESGIPSDVDPSSLRESDLSHSELLERRDDLSWKELAEWVRACLVKWGYSLRDYDTILLVSHFSTAELSHVTNFWEEAEVRRVSAAQVYNASYRINKSQRLVVMDNYHFWNVGNNGNASLFAVGEKFGERKIELPPDLPIDKTKRAYLSDARFRVYALWDAVICARVFRKFRDRLWDDYRVDVIQYPTSASLAMAVYRQRFLPDDLVAPVPDVRRQAWLSLWGGRAEAYAQGDFFGDYTLRDVTSLYPSSERLLEYLPRAEDWIERPEPISWRGLCRVRFTFPSSVKYPCLPVFHDGKLIFPLSGVSDCSLDEAREAQRLGAELDFLKCFEYDAGDRTLTDFMEYFIRQKTENEELGKHDSGAFVPCPSGKKCKCETPCEYKDAVGRELSKLMMNSLIGKLSQNKGDVDIEALKAFAEHERLPLDLVVSPSFFHVDKPRALPRIGGHIMPEWSALILGKARSVMSRLLNDVGESLICSTDSMLVPSELNPRVDVVMREVGVVLTNKNGNKISKRVRVVRNRVYAAETEKGELIFGASHAIHLGSRKRGCKPCEEKTCKEPSHNALRFILSEETSYKKVKRNGLKTAIRKGERFFGEREDTMRFMRQWDQKRRVQADGTTSPWRSCEEYDETLGRSKGLIEIEG